MLPLLFSLALAGPPPRVAVDTSVARVLAEAQLRHETKVACLHGSYDPSSNTMVFDRAVLADACGADARGVVGFIAEPERYEAQDVVAKMAVVLRARPSLWLAGEVHGVERIFNGTGWQLAAQVWFAIRVPEPKTVAA